MTRSLPPATSLVVFSTRAYAELSESIRKLAGAGAGILECTTFPDGERYQRVGTDVRDRGVVVVGGTIDDTNTLELFDLAYSLVKQGARTLTMILPYFGYGTMERAVKKGEVVTAKARACLLSAIPPAADGSRVVLLDLHSEGIPHYFEGALCPVHLYAKDVVLDAIRELGGGDFVLGATDAGRAKWVESLANELDVDAGFVFKRRLDGEHTEVVAMNADVGGKAVVVYDDMIRTGGSLVHAARAYRDAGATRVSVVATHGLFPFDAVERIRASGTIDRIVVTDSHPRAREVASDFVTVKTTANLFADFLRT
ncbi:MAG: ribose-phosphate diphosphokinase [Polyangiaceae bacterium]